MSFKNIALLLLLGITTFLFSQDYSDQVPQLKRYNPKDVIDPEYGIIMYNELIFSLGGDSTRYDKKGYNIQGWVEDYFTDGSLLHKGFYVDGQLKVFKNYYPNGQIERTFRVIDIKRAELTVYYQDGKLKSEVFYFSQAPQKQTDYYPNGNIEYIEENEKDMKYLFKRNSFYENGVPQIVFEITDKKKKLFIHKEFYANGKTKEEGKMIFLESINDYAKEGEWVYYVENGTVSNTEKYHHGHKTD